MHNITRLLSAIGHEHLLPLVYAEQRQLAAQWLVLEKPGQTLQETRWRVRRTCL
jgi:hypothetical protein